MYDGFKIVTPQQWQSLITHVEEKVEDHYWEANGLEELLESFIIDIGSSNNDDNISDDGEDVDDTEKMIQLKMYVCSYNTLFFSSVMYTGLILH